MADLCSTRRLTRTACKPGPFTVSRHDGKDGYSSRATASVTVSFAAESARCRWRPAAGGAARLRQGHVPDAGPEGTVPGSRSRLRPSALTATMKLDPDMDKAAISGRSTSPNAGAKTPAAMGRATAL